MNNSTKIVFIRHGESLANIDHRFSGWLDVDLTVKGHNDAYLAGVKLKNLNFQFNICYTSMLKRAIKTSWSVLDGLNSTYIPINKVFNLNERHYGELSGLNKKEGILKYGINNINSWLNEYNSAPPPIDEIKYNILFEKYKLMNFNKIDIPYTESLQDVLNRVLTLWNNIIIKNIKLNKNILIISHSNTLKILTKFLDKNKNDKINLIPNTTPIVYEFDKYINKIKSYTL